MRGAGDTVISHFADRLISTVRRLGHPLCVGLDPHLDRIPACFREGAMLPTAPATVRSVESFLRVVIDRVEGKVAIVKPQIAFFEQLGWRGIEALTRLVEHARAAGLLVLLDAKRGDIGSTAAGYARAYFGDDAALPVDALTVNPYLGPDTLTPFIEAAQDDGGGVFVLVKTSNPGSGALQDLEVDGSPVSSRVADWLASPAERLAGPVTGWSSIGVVVGATYPEDADRVRAVLPRSLFLIPGFGAQGAGADDAVRSFVRGPTGILEGGVVNASRGVLFPEGSLDADAATYDRLLDQTIDRATSELSAAVA